MKNRILPLLLLLSLTTCKTFQLQPLKTKTITTTQDSVATRTEVKDSLLLVRKSDTASLSKAIQELTELPIKKTSGSATLSLWRKGEQIEAECECAELKEAVKLYKEIVEFYINKETTTETRTTVVQKEVPGFLKPFLWLGYLVGIGLLLFGGLKIYRLIKPF